MGTYRDLMALVREPGMATHGALLGARSALSRAIGGGWATSAELEWLVGALRDALTLDAPNDLDAYMQAMEFDRSPEGRLWLPRRGRLMRLCRDLQWFETDPGAEFLSVSMPPRTGKSSICSMAMTWHLGRDPMHSNLMTAHSDKLTKHFYQQCLQFVSDQEYRFAECFPDAPLVWQSGEDEAFSLRRRGAYPSCTCRSVEGTLTGAVEVGEGGWLYADDLVKDLEEAMSPRRLQSKWEAYVNQCYDRRKRGARQLMVGTRWDVADPIGRMVALHEGEPGFRVLTIPALDPETGESNFDYLYGVGFDRHYYLDMRRTTDEATYAAKYDGDPFVRQGQLYSPDALERYLALPDGEPSRVVAVVDTKGAGSDYQACPVAAKWEPQVVHNRLLLRQLRAGRVQPGAGAVPGAQRRPGGALREQRGGRARGRGRRPDAARHGPPVRRAQEVHGGQQGDPHTRQLPVGAGQLRLPRPLALRRRERLRAGHVADVLLRAGRQERPRRRPGRHGDAGGPPRDGAQGQGRRRRPPLLAGPHGPAEAPLRPRGVGPSYLLVPTRTYSAPPHARSGPFSRNGRPRAGRDATTRGRNPTSPAGPTFRW